MKTTKAGDTHNGLIAIKPMGHNQQNRPVWEYQCHCGTKFIARPTDVNSGKRYHCGCGHSKAISEAKTVHGNRKSNGIRSSEYIAWSSMRGRCLNPHHPDYESYGGRGITIDPGWSEFVNFLVDMGTKPEPNLTLERVNNELGYTKSNCKWATSSEQANNRRSNVNYSY